MSETYDEVATTHTTEAWPLLQKEPQLNETINDQEPNIVDLLKQDLQKITASKTVFISVQGYETAGLQVKYKLPYSGKEIDHIINDAQREFKDDWSRGLYSSIDLMVHLCDGLYVQPNGSDEPVKLDPQMSGEPVKFDTRLVSIMGWTDVDSARQTVMKLFANVDTHILAHSAKLNRWLTNTRSDVSREFWQGE